ncbi:MAG: hypothetical protein ACPGVG_17380 [Mycobacterium sp.]
MPTYATPTPSVWWGTRTEARDVITTDTPTAADDLLRVDGSAGAFTITLPPAGALAGKRLTLLRTEGSANSVTVDANGAETIGSSASTTLDGEGKSVTVQAREDGSGWDHLSEFLSVHGPALVIESDAPADALTLNATYVAIGGTGSSGTMRFNLSTGTLGVGDGPHSAYRVAATSAGTGAYLANDVPNGDWPFIFDAASGSGLQGIDVNSGDGRLRLRDSGGTEGVRITPNGDSYLLGGDLGLGTSGPDEKLHLEDAGDTWVHIESTGASNVGLRLTMANGSQDVLRLDSNNNLIMANTSGTHSGDFFFDSENDWHWRLGGSTTYMRLDSAGSLGLGTAPTASEIFAINPGSIDGITVSGLGSNKWGIKMINGTQTNGAGIATSGANGTQLLLREGLATAVRIYSNSTASYLNGGGGLVLGSTSIDANALLEVSSTAKGIMFPRMTTTQRNAMTSPNNALVIYNTSVNKFQGRAGGAWVDLH